MIDGIKPELATHKWLLDHVEHVGDACLPWPWFCDPGTGYGRVTHKRKVRYAHRLMCELVNGPPPTPKHQASHRCGKGHEGCVNPRHLSWKTNRENQMDRAVHGTWRPKGYLYVLTPEIVAEIRAIGDKETKTALAKRFNTSRDTIAKILDGRAWSTPGEYPKRGFAPGDPNNPSVRRKRLGIPRPPSNRGGKSIKILSVFDAHKDHTLNQLAELSGSSPGYVWKVLNKTGRLGTRQPPTPTSETKA